MLTIKALHAPLYWKYKPVWNIMMHVDNLITDHKVTLHQHVPNINKVANFSGCLLTSQLYPFIIVLVFLIRQRIVYGTTLYQ